MSSIDPSLTPTRGRPKSEAKYRQILDAAVRLFMDNGYGGTSVDEIALKAGVSKQTVYSHFGSKDELFRQCVTCKMDSYELAEEFFDRQAPVDQMLRAIAHHFSAMLLSPEAINVKRTVIAESDTQLGTLFYEAGPRRLKQMLADYLEDLDREGALKIADSYTAACQFLYMLHGDEQMRRLMAMPPSDDTSPTERYVESCVDMFLRAYRATS